MTLASTQFRLLVGVLLAAFVLAACGHGGAGKSPTATGTGEGISMTPRPSAQASVVLPAEGTHVADYANRLDAETRRELEAALGGILARGGPDIVISLRFQPGISHAENLGLAEEVLFAFARTARATYQMVVVISLDATLDHGVISWAADDGLLTAVPEEDIEAIVDREFTPLAADAKLEDALLALVDGLNSLLPSAETSASASSAVDLTSCRSTGFSHHAPKLEAVLPPVIGGRLMERWSLAGWCFVSSVVTGDEEFGELQEWLADEGVSVDGLAYAIAGRSDTETDPPYFVHVVAWDGSPQQGEVGLFLMFGSAGFLDPTAYATGTFDRRVVGGKDVDVALADQLVQDDHQRGSAYVYAPDGQNRVYVVITDDEVWAADALSHLP